MEEIMSKLTEEEKNEVLRNMTCLLFGHDFSNNAFVCRRCGRPKPS